VGSESMLKLLIETSQEDGKDYTLNLVNSQVVPSYEDTSFPAVKEYRALMDTYHPMPPADLIEADYQPLPYSFVSLEGFLNAKLLVEILKRLNGQPVRAQVAPTVEDIHDFDLGIGAPISFDPQRNQGSDAVYYTTVKDSRFVPLYDWKEWLK
ncbi:MAG TPA: ABC transporter substrate-binding protein, partial [Candidatus Binatia bacterium]|nr:ABC transporter substrate-binding protein [Candidatus Binatia bacterium]